jgi:hypothetical protein
MAVLPWPTAWPAHRRASGRPGLRMLSIYGQRVPVEAAGAAFRLSEPPDTDAELDLGGWITRLTSGSSVVLTTGSCVDSAQAIAEGVTGCNACSLGSLVLSRWCRPGGKQRLGLQCHLVANA